MNITTNELLLLNKIKFAGKENPTNTATIEPEVASDPNAGMKALSFQGLKNLLSNPGLAQNLGVANDVELRKGDPSYVAPFSTNVAFKANPGKMAKVGMGVVMGVAALGTAGTMTSCKPERGDVIVTQEVTVDMSAFTEMIAQMNAILLQISAKLDKLDKTNEILAKMQESLIQILSKVSNMEITIEQGFQELFNQFILVQANQKLILDQLVQNGMTQEEANKLIQDLIEAVKNHTMTAQEAWNMIMAKLDTTNGLLNNIYNYLQDAFQKLEAYMNDMRADAKTIIANQNTANSHLANLEANSYNMVNQLNAVIIGQESMAGRIQAAINDQTISINANVTDNIDKLAALLNMTRTQLLATINQWGITETQLQQMSVYQLLEAINNNTNQVKDLKTIVMSLLTEYQAGRMTAEEFARAILEALDQVNATLSDIYNLIQSAYEKMDQYHAEAMSSINAIKKNTGNIANDVSVLKNSVNGISSQLSVVIENQESMVTRFEEAINAQTISINDNVNAKLDQLAGLVNMTRAQLIATLNKWGITQAQLTSMSVYQLLAAINENTQEIKNLKQAFIDIMSQYEAGIIDIQGFADAVLDLLQQIKSGIDSINATLSALYDEIKAGFNRVNNNLVDIYNQGKVTNEILANMNKNIIELKENQSDYHAELQELISIARNNYDELKSHPEKYADMLKNLGLTVQQAINMSAEQFIAAVQQHDQNTQATLGAQTDLLQKIYDKLSTMGGQELSPEILNALKAIAIAVNNGNEVTAAQLQALLDKLDGIADQLAELIDLVKGLKSTVNNMSVQLGEYNKYWQQALAKLDSYTEALMNIQNKLDAGNATMEEIKELIKKANALLAEIKSEQVRASAFLENVVSNSEIIINKLNNMKDIDYDRLEAAWKAISDADYERYSKLIKDLKIDPSQFETIADLINAINIKVGEIKNDTEYAKKIYDLLKDIDWTKPDYTAKLDRIIELLEALKCCCGENEGIIGELEGLLNG